MASYFYSISTNITSGKYHPNIKKEILASSIVTPFHYTMTNGDQLEIAFTGELSAPDKVTLDNLVLNHSGLPNNYKIKSYTNPQSARKPVSQINYITELNTRFFPKRTMVKGEIQKVEWFSDEALTDKVIEVDIVYTRDQYGFALNRTTTRKWVLSDGQFGIDIKTTKKVYTNNTDEQIKEGIRRRQNIVDNLQMPTLSFLLETMAPMDPNLILLTGREFLDRMENEATNFVKNSSTVTDTMDPNFGRKKIIVWLEAQPDSWLSGTPSALGGTTTILDWLKEEFNI